MCRANVQPEAGEIEPARRQLLALAHESGHKLLFGMCIDGPLVENNGADDYMRHFS